MQFCQPEHTTAQGAVMIIHGGYWREKYRADLGLPLAQDLAQRGIPAYNLEYRRGPGSAAKMLADARLALGLIKEEGPITLIGHSAGAQLACVLAASDPRVSQVISQAGVLDLEWARRLKLSDGAVDELLADAPMAMYSPVELWPSTARVVIFHGRDDQDVPVKIARLAADKAAAVGQEYRFALFASDHYTWIDPHSSQWAACVAALSPLHY
ncbi:hypothetical protein [Arthrobacter sp. S41]|uniref:alpha/beta hydrolase n=1 Tax=Arthrobacter sp. S41 TaxID=2509721 RepID=UPI001035CFD8|nr:hypothetical protein [Arthrobacter sp. S41]TAP28780.1 hypothetical protein EYR88_11030 [Arthrobacter sp. S41]